MPLSKTTIDDNINHLEYDEINIKTTSRFFTHLIKLVLKGFSPLVLIVGERGMGKSFSACWLAYILSKAFGKEMTVENNCIYSLDQAIDFIFEKTNEVLILDEMIEMGFRREWQQKVHHNFYKVMMTQRIKRHTYIMVLPQASDLDKIFAKNVSFIIFMKKRGLLVIYKLPKRYTSFKVPELDRLRPFETIAIKIKDVPENLWEDYQIYSETAKTNILERIKNKMKIGTQIQDSADKIIDFLEDQYG